MSIRLGLTLTLTRTQDVRRIWQDEHFLGGSLSAMPDHADGRGMNGGVNGGVNGAADSAIAVGEHAARGAVSPSF